MERAEAFFFFILMMLWPDAFGFLSCLFTVLVTLTAIIRLVQFRNQYSEPYPNPTDEHRATPLKQDEPT